MPKIKRIQVTKLDAAMRQVETAAKLFFANGDPVSIHTLLFASVEIIDGLYKRETKERLFFENAAMKRLPGMVQTVKAWGAFFKHGREWELDKVLTFNTASNLVLFSACIAGLTFIRAPNSDFRDAVLYWLLVHHPDFFPPEMLKKRPTGEALRDIRRVNKKEFLQHVLRVAKVRRRSESRRAHAR